MEGLAVVGAAFVLIVVSYLGLSAVLRRIPVTSPRLPTGPIPVRTNGWSRSSARSQATMLSGPMS